jgi:CRP-like cAMP-binding protein
VHLLLVGSSDELIEVAEALMGSDHTVTLMPGDTMERTVVVQKLTAPGRDSEVRQAQRLSTPQALLSRGDDYGRLTDHAYPAAVRSQRTRGRPVRYGAGERITIQDGWPLEVSDGAIALTALHADSTEVMIGVVGPGDYVLHHPSDTCSIEAVALSVVVGEMVDWNDVVGQESLAAALASRVLRSQAWAAAQAHPYIEQRLLGILNVLSEQFGVSHDGGRIITIRLTHGQLAAITGATRPTITRVISTLCRTGHLGVVGSGNSRRLCVYSAGI